MNPVKNRLTPWKTRSCGINAMVRLGDFESEHLTPKQYHECTHEWIARNAAIDSTLLSPIDSDIPTASVYVETKSPGGTVRKFEIKVDWEPVISEIKEVKD